MKIDQKTKVSALIKENPKAIEALAGMDPKLNKLKNPILRKVLAKRVNLADVSKITGIRIELFYKTLKEIGFELGSEAFESKSLKEDSSIKEDKDLLVGKNIIEMDVRPILEGGEDPFNKIMAKLDEVDANDILKVINSFEPIPLMNLLKAKGYHSFSDHGENSYVQTYFIKNLDVPTVATKPASTEVVEESFDSVLAKYKDNLVELDVRALEMPMPMASILQAIEDLPPKKALFVFHKRFPRFLIDELKTRAFILVSKEIDDNNTHLIIFKK